MFVTVLAAAIFALILAVCGVIVGIINALVLSPSLFSDTVKRAFRRTPPMVDDADDGLALLLKYVGAVILYSIAFVVPFGSLLAFVPDSSRGLVMPVAGAWFLGYNLLLAVGAVWHAPRAGYDWNDGEYGARTLLVWGVFHILQALALIITSIVVLLVIMGSLSAILP